MVLSWFALIEGFSSALLPVNNGSQAARPSLAREEASQRRTVFPLFIHCIGDISARDLFKERMIKVELCWQHREPQYICGVYLVPGVESWRQPGGGGGGYPVRRETFLDFLF